jgi:hypothetical protein
LHGTWRTIDTSDEIQGGEITSRPIEGYFIFTPAPDRRVAVLYGSIDEPSVDGPAPNSYKLAWTGTWQAQGNSVEFDVDFSTSPFITGKFSRFFDVSGSHLTLSTAIHESKVAPGTMKVTKFTMART